LVQTNQEIVSIWRTTVLSHFTKRRFTKLCHWVALYLTASSPLGKRLLVKCRITSITF